MNNVIRNIVKVEYIESRWLKNVVIVNNNEVYLRYWRNFTQLPTVGLSSIEVSDRVENNNRIYTVKLQALLTSAFNVNYRKLSFRVTTALGVRYLIGTDSHPFCNVTVVDKYPSLISERGGCNILAEYSNTISMLQIID